ncbi:hypothetical protein [Dyella sp. RRB7]|uniref:hypothetical protein n=1 Tax=Dyella sp. RRB7 TaxID=2919502 RepID=UPI001FA98624|nr:hypothetical protein [Dyella sp. RRB7]
MKKGLAFIALLGCLAMGVAHAAAPKGWFINGPAQDSYAIGSQPSTRQPGGNAAFIRSIKDNNGFGSLMQTIKADAYRGKRVRLSGFLRSKDAYKTGLWMRVDGPDRRILGFDNMELRALHGDNDWKDYSIVLDVPADATDIAFGFLLEKKGEVQAEDFRLETVGKDVPTTDLPRPELPAAPVNMSFAQ